MTTSPLVDAYFERIGWAGGTSPTFATASGILRAHMQSIPFENLDVLLGRPIRLDIDSLHEKLVRRRRGGYCFEQTTLFAHVLTQIGFHPVCHSARVVLLFPRTQSPRAHMFLTLTLPEGRFVFDPGFGGPASPAPVPVVDHGQAGPVDATHWLTQDDGYWVLRYRLDGDTRDAWVSTLEPDHPVDFEMANHFTATHPRSPFVSRLMLAILTPDGRIGVMNRDLTARHGSDTHSAQIADRAALRHLLLDRFGIDLPESETLRVPAVPEWS